MGNHSGKRELSAEKASKEIWHGALGSPERVLLLRRSSETREFFSFHAGIHSTSPL
uniref:Myelin basic protein n=1 Tax=Mus musculus TaxID=10090 RepID=D3Z6U4_MOUSE